MCIIFSFAKLSFKAWRSISVLIFILRKVCATLYNDFIFKYLSVIIRMLSVLPICIFRHDVYSVGNK
jgi:hypothetical protein